MAGSKEAMEALGIQEKDIDGEIHSIVGKRGTEGQ